MLLDIKIFLKECDINNCSVVKEKIIYELELKKEILKKLQNMKKDAKKNKKIKILNLIQES